MNPFVHASACPGCGYQGTGMEGSPFNKAVRCPAKATDVPLRCEHCADPAELAQWPQEKYEKDGHYYKPITKVIIHDEQVEIANPEFDPIKDADPDNPDRKPATITVPRQRPETVLDEAATIAAGPLTVPRTIPHVHRTCLVCSTIWPESLKA